MIIHLEHIEESEVEDDEALEERDDNEEGRVEHGQPADGLDGGSICLNLNKYFHTLFIEGFTCKTETRSSLKGMLKFN